MNYMNKKSNLHIKRLLIFAICLCCSLFIPPLCGTEEGCNCAGSTLASPLGGTEGGSTSPFNFASRLPKHEVRAVWITTIGGLDWPHNYARDAYSIEKQKQELRDILDLLKAANVNMVMLQTRVRGTLIYPSDLEPWDGCMSGRPGVSPGYDPLLFAIDECHRRGMQLHAWIVCIPIGENVREGVKHLKRVHPELYVKIKSHGFMRPDKEGTGDYIAQICREITERYDIDGIHLDYIRYPEEGKLPGTSDGKRENITRIVRKVCDAVKPLKPWIMMSCSPVGKYNMLPRYSSHGWDAYSAVYQDAQGWLRDGLMDALFPMMYFQGNQFYPFAADWKENSHGRIIAPGLGVYFLSPKEKNWQLNTITREMYVLRQLGMGHAYFRSKFFTDNTKGIYTATKDEIDLYPTLIPPMTWMQKSPPTSPKDIKVVKNEAGDLLTWSGATNNNDSPYLIYNVYASEDYPVDITCPRNLIATRVMGNSLQIASSGYEFNYAVTAVDRYGNESVPYGKKIVKQSANLKTFKVNGNWLELPAKPNTIDADYLLVKDMIGKTVTTLPWPTPSAVNDNRAYIANLKDGNYQLYTLSHKGIVHRLGFFKLKASSSSHKGE